MFDFENKPIKDWTLAEAKTYCFYNSNKTCSSNKSCALHNSHSCAHIFANMEFKSNTIPQFTTDEIAFCRLIKKTCPWANYIARTSYNNIFYLEYIPKFSDDKSYFIIDITGNYKKFDNNFFPQIKPLTYYTIDDIIKQGDGSNA